MLPRCCKAGEEVRPIPPITTGIQGRRDPLLVEVGFMTPRRPALITPERQEKGDSLPLLKWLPVTLQGGGLII